MSEYMVGTAYALKVNMLGNLAGTIGYVFNQYEDYDDKTKLGVQIIFPNGEYDGFSAKEQERFLEVVGYKWEYCTYQFTNVIQVGIDFAKGYWKW
jgi:hypothetical protein